MKFDLNNSSVSFGTIVMGWAAQLADGMGGCCSLLHAAPTCESRIQYVAYAFSANTRVSWTYLCLIPIFTTCQIHIHPPYAPALVPARNAFEFPRELFVLILSFVLSAPTFTP